MRGDDKGFWVGSPRHVARSRPSGIDEISLPTSDGTVRVGTRCVDSGGDLQAVGCDLLLFSGSENHRWARRRPEQMGDSCRACPRRSTDGAPTARRVGGLDLVTIGADTVDHVLGPSGAGAEAEHPASKGRTGSG